MAAFVSRKIARTTFVTLPIFPLNYGVSKLVPEGNEIKQIISFVVPCFKKKINTNTHILLQELTLLLKIKMQREIIKSTDYFHIVVK